MKYATLLLQAGVIAAALVGLASFAQFGSHDVSKESTTAVDALSAHEELRDALLAQLSEDEKGKAITPATLLIASLGEKRFLAGAALPKSDDGSMGVLIVSGPLAPPVPTGLYSLRIAGSGMTIDIVDRAGRVVHSVSLDPPLDDGAQASGAWTRTFFTLARNLGPKLK